MSKKKYIDADLLKEKLCRFIDDTGQNYTSYRCGYENCLTAVQDVISGMSTIDIPEIVYCRDCKYFVEEYGRCVGQGLDFDDDCPFKNENDFCSCGEREEIMEEYNENKTM